MKSVIYHPGIKQNGALHDLAELATNRLNEIVGQYGVQTEAEWDATEDESKRSRLVTLTLRDLPEVVRGKFAPAELEDKTVLNLRLAHLWGDLLQARTHRLIRGLMDNGDSESN